MEGEEELRWGSTSSQRSGEEVKQTGGCSDNNPAALVRLSSEARRQHGVVVRKLEGSPAPQSVIRGHAPTAWKFLSGWSWMAAPGPKVQSSDCGHSVTAGKTKSSKTSKKEFLNV